MKQTQETKVKTEFVGEHSQTREGIAWTALATTIHDELIRKSYSKGEIEVEEYREKHKADWKKLDELQQTLLKMDFFAQGVGEHIGEFLCEMDTMRGENGNEFWKVYFVQGKGDEGETKSGKCVKGHLYFRKQIPIAEMQEMGAVEYFEVKRKAMIPKSVMSGTDNAKKFWWCYYQAYQKDSTRVWER